MMSRTRALLAITGLCLCLTGKSAAAEIVTSYGIVITEVMAAPKSASTGEFVELYNAGDEPVDLQGWILGDPKDANDTITDFIGPHDIGLEGTVLAPGACALVVDPDYEGEYGDQVIAGSDPTSLLMLTIKGDSMLGNSLGNSVDIVFIKKDDITIDRFEWTKSAGGNGISWERIQTNLPTDASNIAPSKAPSGSTPGFRNSVATGALGKEEPEDTTDPEDPEESEDPTVPPATQEPMGNVIINEIMFDPGPNRSEWIELYNRGNDAIDLSGWSLQLEHKERARRIADAGLSLTGQGYLVIASDTAKFMVTYPAFDGSVAEAAGGWEGLRNSGARLLLLDANGSEVHVAEYDEETSPDAGRSAELVNPDFDPPVWGPSAAVEGGTPGQRNSLYVTRIPDGVSLHLSNNPFSPDGDNHEDVCLVTVDLPAPHGILHAMVFDISGRFIKTLIDQTTVASRHVFTWDGTDQDGRRLPVGPYILYVEQMLPALNRLTASKHLVVIAASL